MADKESEGKNADAGDKAFAKGEDKPRRRRSRGGEDDAASKDAGAAGDKAAEKPAQKPSRSKERRSRAVNGWGAGDKPAAKSMFGDAKAEDDNKSNSGKQRRSAQSAFESSTPTEILFIPDLDEEAEEDITAQVAAAPKNNTKRLQGLSELERDLKYTIPSSDNGIDLTPLASTLAPAQITKEGEERWTFDSLLLEVTHSINEKEALKALQEEQAAAAVAQRKKDMKNEEEALAKISLKVVSGDGKDD